MRCSLLKMVPFSNIAHTRSFSRGRSINSLSFLPAARNEVLAHRRFLHPVGARQFLKQFTVISG